LNNTEHGEARETAPIRPYQFMWRFCRPYRRQYFLGMILAVFFVLASLCVPYIIGSVVADIDAGRMTVRRLLLYFVTLLTIDLCSGVVRYFQRMLMIGASRRVEYDLRNHFFRHVQRLSQRFFHRMQTGDIMARATNDLNYVRDFVGPGIMGSIDMIVLPLSLGMMIFISPRLALVTAIPLPLLSLFVYVFVRFMNRQSKKVQELFSELSARVQENLAGARVVKAYGIAEREARDFHGIAERHMRANRKLTVAMFLAWPIIAGFVGTLVLLVIWQGGAMVIEGTMPFHQLTRFLLYMLMIAWPLAQFGWVLSLYQRGEVGMKRMARILEEKPEIADGDATDFEAKIDGGSFRFEGISFAYQSSDGDSENERPPMVLDRLDFEVPAGKTMAVVGATGSGKSTVVSLLTREYTPHGGQIFVDENPLEKIPLATLRGAIGYVPQDTLIFSDTVQNNICLGKPNASEEEIARACEIAQFSEALQAMPDGLQTLLGERGVNLSGGQKQRLALARAVLCDPKILILDDALSAVDTHTEERILEGLRAVTQGRTSLIIAHRLSSIRHADEIIVLDAGRIAEQGGHETLLALDGKYTAMYRRQLLETALEEGEAVI
jgi:ATP-binding cassette, subfamily B, multidrug efflux pump